MSFQIDKFKNEIRAICTRLAVARLDLFGSGSTDEFSSESDLDFLVDFLPNQQDLLGKFLSLKEQLEGTLKRKIDIVSANAIRNPYFKESIERTRKNVFAS